MRLLGTGERQVAIRDEPNVIVESLRTERHRVEVRPGVQETRTCLVLRMRHNRDQSIVARVDGLSFAGAEHRLYTSVGRYTARFWFDGNSDLTRESAELAAARLRLISVTAFKKEAQERGYFLEISDLPAPEPTDVRPRPPLELK